MDECDFSIHEACANAPCKKYHALNPYPLTLKVVTCENEDNGGYFSCDACQRESCAVYENFGGENGGSRFRLDLRCASVSEPFEYLGHDHPLYLALNPEEESVLPYPTRQDINMTSISSHFMKRKGQMIIQSGVMYAKEEQKGFYSCEDCCTTLHIDCLLGEDMYMKPDHNIMYKKGSVVVRK
ncbi:unnamed protein product [Arabidopsis thaliana]|uniref:Cysteine/Histidine-rich C1 domain family protein n=1 Tax=Arabidopsis thaliana TaxID=3702 RepID=A0A5S9WXW1_ARATH|nr:unnamed protein product [Arabidopsis thaliana]